MAKLMMFIQAWNLPWSKRKNDELAAIPPTNQFGLQVHVAPTIPVNSPTLPIDIIFVHGLGGSSKGTWTHPESNSFWPLWLPNVQGLENARITTFGYDSTWNEIWKPNNILDISDFADQLLNSLRRHYSLYGNVSIVLPICQSFIVSRRIQFLSHTVWVDSS
jgi:hypothetical protein